MISRDGVLKQALELEGVHIHLIKHVLHIVEIHVVFRVAQVAHDGGDPGRHFAGINGTHLTGLINGVVA